MHARRIALAVAGVLALATLTVACAPRAHAQNAVQVCQGGNLNNCLIPSNGGLPTAPLCNGLPCSQANPFFTVFAAGEFHVGEVGNNQSTVTSALANTATSYAAGVAVGGLQTLANMTRVAAAAGNPGTGGDILATVLTSSVANTVALDVFYFSATLTTSTCTDTSAFALTAADATKVVGIAHVTDWSAGNPAAVGQAVGTPMPYVLNNATSLFACVVARGAATVAASGVNLQVRVLRQ